MRRSETSFVCARREVAAAAPAAPLTHRCVFIPPGRYHLVKLLEKFGNVKQFDFLFHKSGPLEGQPRGYCFVNFNTREVRALPCHCPATALHCPALACMLCDVMPVVIGL